MWGQYLEEATQGIRRARQARDMALSPALFVNSVQCAASCCLYNNIHSEEIVDQKLYVCEY